MHFTMLLVRQRNGELQGFMLFGVFSGIGLADAANEDF